MFYVWLAETGEKVHTLEGHTNWVQSVCCSADGKRIVSGSQDKTVMVPCCAVVVLRGVRRLCKEVVLM